MAAMLLSQTAHGLILGPNDVDVVADQTTTDANGNSVLAVSTTWTADKTYVLTDKVFVTGGATLTIDPGTRIYSTLDDQSDGDATNDEFGAVIVTRGSMIDAAGTCEAPIIFDSIDNLEAERGVDIDGDAVVATALGYQDVAKWGGVILLGNAIVSQYDGSGLVGEDQIEGFSEAVSPTNDLDGDNRVDIVEYGGGTTPDNADNSGVLQYVSIRHGGRTFVANKEINGLTLGGVGSGTTIDHVEVFANSDDGIEFFGGTVNTSHMVMAYNFDDGFDFDEGHSGEHQFWLVVQDHAPVSGADNGGEWDGTDGSKAGTNILSAPKLFNLTFVGPGTNGGVDLGNDKGNNAMLMDDLFNGKVYNSVFTEFSGWLIELEGDGDGGSLVFRNNLIGAFGQYDGFDNLSVLDADARTTFAPIAGGGELFDDFGDPVNGNTAPGTDPMFRDLTLGSVYDLRPAAGSPLLSGATTTAAVAGASAFIGDPGYRGAFDADSNWASLCGWTKLSQTIMMPSGLDLGPNDVDVVAEQTTTDANGNKVLAVDTDWTADKTYVL
ncbi:MAG: hypothetical protein O3A87_04130, partial [Verrucomicrobia bacterium]|nr:hypothetical protein [Verrucomicrobiota bacterium]